MAELDKLEDAQNLAQSCDLNPAGICAADWDADRFEQFPIWCHRPNADLILGRVRLHGETDLVINHGVLLVPDGVSSTGAG